MAEETEHLESSHRKDSIHEEQCNREFIRKLANDYLHFKIYGPESNTITDIENMKELSRERERVLAMTQNNNNNNNNNNNKNLPFKKTAKILRKVSVELERSNSDFFDSVCNNLNLNDRDPERAFKQVSEEVLCPASLNWGRVVSLFTFGGKLAEWFWRTHQEDKIEELEEWLAESLSGKEDWIVEHGGWENFNKTFEGKKEEDNSKMDWLKPGLLMCVGVSLAAVFTFKMQ